MNRIRKLSNLFYKLCNPLILIFALAVFAFFISVILPGEAERSAESTGSSQSPDTAFFYSAETLYEIAEQYGAEGRKSYVESRYTFDVVWPLAYGFFLIAALSYLFKSSRQSTWRLINLLPLAGMMFDFLENSAASIVMLRYPASTPVVAELTPIFTLLKWLSIYASFVFLVIGIVYRIWAAIKKRVRQNK